MPTAARRPTREASLPYGRLVSHQPGIDSIGRKTPGHAAFKDPDGTPHTFGLHCEFEGEGNKTLRRCGGCPGLRGRCADRLPAAALAARPHCRTRVRAPHDPGRHHRQHVRGGSPATWNLIELNPIKTDADGNIPGASMVFVAGTWVYDSLHEGWNEIHPIKQPRSSATEAAAIQTACRDRAGQGRSTTPPPTRPVTTKSPRAPRGDPPERRRLQQRDHYLDKIDRRGVDISDQPARPGTELKRPSPPSRRAPQRDRVPPPSAGRGRVRAPGLDAARSRRPSGGLSSDARAPIASCACADRGRS